MSAHLDIQHKPPAGPMEPHADFVYPDEPEQADAQRLAAEAFKRVFRWCFDVEGKNKMFAVYRRVFVIGTALDPNMTGVRNYRELAKLLNCTKAEVSQILRILSAEFGVQFHQRTKTSREHMREAQLRRRCRACGQPMEPGHVCPGDGVV